jgi:CRISPR/Cas system-associated exonuclease Cas4 (RecB family)
MNQFSVTEVVTAARCPRQLVMLRENRRLSYDRTLPYGGVAIGWIAHQALKTIVRNAPSDPHVGAALAGATPSADEVEKVCYRLAYVSAYPYATKDVPNRNGNDLARLDGVLRNISNLIAALLIRARMGSPNAATAISRALLAGEDPVSIDIDDYKIEGIADLLCYDVETKQTWVWDLKTYAGTDRAQEEQVRLYAHAYSKRGITARAALLHVTNDRIELREAPSMTQNGIEALGHRLREMSAWLQGIRTPPSAAERRTCRECPVQTACWTRWGRTLPDADSDDPASDNSPMGPSGRLPITERVPAEAASRPLPLPAPLRSFVIPTTPHDPLPLLLGYNEKTGSSIRIEPSDLLRHIAVFGASGSGKTYFAKSIVEEAVLAGVPALVFDMQGDLVQFAQPAPDVPPHLASRQSLFKERAEVRIFTPLSDAGLRVSLNPLKLPPSDLNEDARAFCHRAIAENLLGAVTITRAWRDQAREYIVQHLEAAPATLSLEDLVERIRDPSDLPEDPLLPKESQRTALADQLRLLTRGTQKHLFQRGRRFDVADLLKPMEPNKIPLNIIWLNALGDVDAKRRFVAMVLSEVYAWMLRKPSPKPQLLLYLDEVGPYMPSRGEPPSKNILRKIFQEGRKYGVCGVFCTQNFTDVDYKILAQANTKVLGKIGSPQDKDRARKILPSVKGFDAPAAAERLMGAECGHFVASSESLSPPLWFKSRSLLVHHGSPWGEDDITAHTPKRLRAHFGGK